jgi:gliding motility-associated lipoprotein GldH
MRFFLALCIASVFLTGCSNDSRVFEEIRDFEHREWLVTDKPEFEFVVTNVYTKYNLYGDVRNSVAYPFSRFFFTYYLQDSTGAELQKNLMTEYLFDVKTAKPTGSSGIGDMYDHQFLLLKDYQFKNPGKYKVVFEQFMRMDTLPGIMAVGLRVEKASRVN